MSTNATEATWPDLAEGLYERLTGRGAAIRYQFDDMQVEVPRSTGTDTPGAMWRLSGALTISTSERAS